MVGMGLKQAGFPDKLGAVERPRRWTIPPGRMRPQVGQLHGNCTTL